MGAKDEALMAALVAQTRETIERQSQRGPPPRLYPHTARVTSYAPWWAQRMATRSEAETRILVAGRQSGKTSWAGFEVLRIACERPGSYSAVLAPTYPIAQTAIDRLRGLCAEIPGTVWKEQKKRFLLPNGSRIAVFSADREDAVRGPTIDGALWIDEGAYLSERAYEAALGALASGNGRVIVTTTPAGKNWVYQEFTSEDAENARFRFRSADSPYSNKARLRRLRKKMSADKAAQEFDAVFVDDLLLAFPDVSALFVASLPERGGERDLRWVLGLDLGKERDWLVVTAMNKYGEAQVLGRWRHLKWTESVPRLVAMSRDREALVVLDHGAGGGYGGVLIDFLEAEGVSVLPVKTGVVGTKAQIVEQCRADVQWERIHVLENEHSPQLRHELTTFQGLKRVLRGQEVMVYEGPQLEGEHDDCVISLCLANWGRVHGWSGPEEEVEDLRDFLPRQGPRNRPTFGATGGWSSFGGSSGGYRFGAPGRAL
ncbi:MAG: terminase family protein [Planctomycetes bacterium]|nr:terminase family protein [Planctomycetota bacterium]